MTTLRFERIEPASGRVLAIVGETLAAVIGKAETSLGASSTWNVTDQPATSDVFAGLGTGGSDVPYSSLSSATFALPGFHVFTVTASNGDAAKVTAICFPAASLDVARIRYQDQGQSQPRPANERRGVLLALAMAATQAGVETALEAGAAVAPFYGTRPSVLGASRTDSYGPFGAW